MSSSSFAAGANVCGLGRWSSLPWTHSYCGKSGSRSRIRCARNVRTGTMASVGANTPGSPARAPEVRGSPVTCGALGKAYRLARPRTFPAPCRTSLAMFARPGGGMADTTVLEAVIERCAGSSPVPGTIGGGEPKISYVSHTNHCLGRASVDALDVDSLGRYRQATREANFPGERQSSDGHNGWRPESNHIKHVCKPARRPVPPGNWQAAR